MLLRWNLEERFRRSKVGRRIFLLFISCALLPLIAVWLVASGFIGATLVDLSRDSLRDKTKAVGRELIGRLDIAESRLATLTAVVDHGFDLDRDTRRERLVGHLEELFDGIVIASPEGVPRTISGSGIADSEGLVSLFAEGPKLVTRHLDDGSVRVLMGQPLEGSSVDDGAMLIGSIRLAYLEGLQQGSSLPDDVEMVLLGPAGNVLLHSLEANVALPAGLRESIAEVSSGDFEWREENERYIGHYWSLFLNAQYGSPAWTVVLRTSRDHVMAPLSRFSRLLLFIVLLCLMVVVLLSFSQIRRSMVPLVRLQQGAKLIAERRFDTRVQIDSNDEFQQLAESFNAMAAHLGRRFTTLTTLSAIDRAILSSLDEESIVRAVLARFPERFRCEVIALTLVDARIHATGWLYSRNVAEGRNEPTINVHLTADELTSLGRERNALRALALHELPEHLESLAADRITHGLVLPILSARRPLGCITLAYRQAPQFEEEDLVEARHLANQVAVALSNARLLEQVEQANWETLQALARAVDANSAWTAGHSDRVTEMALELARRLDLPESELEIIHKGGLLHDIGKIGIPSEILNKPGRLTEFEMATMRSHTMIGARILEPIRAYAEQLPIVLYHHERYDGKGYPEGLGGEEIPLHARILAVADVYDAVISDRPYRAGWDREEAIAHIRDGAGTQFDPVVVEAFLLLVERPRIPIPETEQAWAFVEAN